MKNFSKTITAIGMSLFTVGAFGQAQFNAQTPAPQKSMIKMHGAPKMLSSKQATNGPLTYLFLDYRYSDSVVSAANGLTYLNWYGQVMNSRYVPADTGRPLSNQALLHSVAVAFDTIFDPNSFQGYPMNSVTNVSVDTIQVLVGHENLSHTRDTIIVQVNSVVGGVPTATVLYTDTIYTDTSLSANNSWNYIYPIVLAPQLTLPGTQKEFAISLQYYGSKLDTFGFLYGFPSFSCNNGTLADTTQFGVYPISNQYPIRANSFSTGWSYFASPKGSQTFTFPSANYGEGIYYPCAQNGVLFWQDMGMEAIVSFNSTLGVNNINNSGLSVAQNYPNPFNKATTINYSLTKSSTVTFNVYDVTGRAIMTNNYGNVAPGQYQVNLGANSFSPGVYFYTFNVNGSTVTKKMVITE